MKDKDQLIAIEKLLDERLEKLQIWELPFHSVIAQMFLHIDRIAVKGEIDTAMDFTSRLSYLYPIISKHCKKDSVNSTTNAISESTPYILDAQFLYAYAHFSLLMPQVHRGTYSVNKNDGTTFTLSFPDDDTRFAEQIDKLYSAISLDMVMEFPLMSMLFQQLVEKVDSGDWVFREFGIVGYMFDHFKSYLSIIKTVPDEIFEKSFGFDYKDFSIFSAAMRAFADFFIIYGHAFADRAEANRSNEELANNLASESFEYAVCTFKNEGLNLHYTLSGLTKEKFYQIFSYFLSVYKETPANITSSRAFCGDGFLPPFIAIDDRVIFSSHAIKYMMVVNNILYSTNKNQKKLFDEEISPTLEPVLVEQLIYLFSHIPDTAARKNVHLSSGEIDLLILHAPSQTVLNLQIKATIAPDSSRTVERVQSRALEGFEQLSRFEELPEEKKLEEINKVFGTSLEKFNVFHILVVRSSAGSVKSWSKNKKFKIVNYVVMGSLLADMLERKAFAFENIAELIDQKQQQLMSRSHSKIESDLLQMQEFTIYFDNIYYDFQSILSLRISCLKAFKYFESSVFDKPASGQ